MNQIVEEIRRDRSIIAWSVFVTFLFAITGSLEWLMTLVQTNVTLPPEFSHPYLIGMILTLGILIARRAKGPRRNQSYETPEMIVDGILMLSWPGTILMMIIRQFVKSPFRYYEVDQ